MYAFAVLISNRFSLNYVLMVGEEEQKKGALAKLKDIDPTRTIYYQYI